jgi:hypothetical protein
MMATAVSFPTEAQAAAAYQALSSAHDAIEAIAWGVRPFADSHYGDDVPPITLENMGVVAKVIAECEGKLEEMGDYLRELKQTMFSLSAVRDEQLGRGKA